MRTLSLTLAVLLQLLAAPLLPGAPPRITFERLLPAAHDLGRAEQVSIVQAIGDDARIEVFLEQFIAHVNRDGIREVRDARFTTGGADAFLAIKTFTCQSGVRESEGSIRDIDGKRVMRKQLHVEATCTARIDVMTKVMKYASTFYAKGEGKSPRVDQVTDDERRLALENAARYAAIDAADRITPRRVRESIELDQTGPAFEDGYAMIELDRFAEARAIWEKELQRHPRSAALRFNIAAVSEALNDRRAAELHYNAARQLAPAEPRYANELRLFARRGTP